MKEEKTLTELRQEVSEIEKDLEKRLSTLLDTYKINQIDIEVGLTSFENIPIGSSRGEITTLIESIKLNIGI